MSQVVTLRGQGMGQVTVRTRLDYPGQRVQVCDRHGRRVQLVDDRIRIPQPRGQSRALLAALVASAAAVVLAGGWLTADVLAGVSVRTAQAGEPLVFHPGVWASEHQAQAGILERTEQKSRPVARRTVPVAPPSRIARGPTEPQRAEPPRAADEGRVLELVRPVEHRVTETVAKVRGKVGHGPPEHAVAWGHKKVKHAKRAF